MTVADVISKIGKARNTIDMLTRYSTIHDLKNGDWAMVEEAIECLEDYQTELESKIVK